MKQSNFIRIAPRLMDEPQARDVFLCCVNELRRCTSASTVATLRQMLYQRIEECGVDTTTRLHLRICTSLFCDLRAQGWRFRTPDSEIQARPPRRHRADAEKHRQQVRAGHQQERDAQLADAATKRFILNLERRQIHGSAWRSIFSLMRDGRDLAEKLAAARDLPDGSDRLCALRAAIDPYIQVAERGRACEHTGLDLYDVWRYFRHTWSIAYRSVPGRQISFLIRDRSAPCHPIIGIGALTSAVVQQKSRDIWIGWHPKRFFSLMAESGYQGWEKWVSTVYSRLLGEIYVDDFFVEGLLSQAELENPTDATVKKLREVATEARKAHRLYPNLQQHKAARPEKGRVDWIAQAKTHLYRSKRAIALAELFEARRLLIIAGFRGASSEIAEVVETKAGRRAITMLLRKVKAAHVGVDMMDIAVCGAVAPYNEILGGKLVSMLMASPDVVSAYEQRYREAVSIIASSIAGREVKRPPRLVLLSTTSLYGLSLSQYNRVRIPAEEVGGRRGQQIRYEIPKIVKAYNTAGSRTVGYGLYHISSETVGAMEVLLARAQKGREVNSIFGEGVNPKMRKVRSALEEIGLPSDLLLQHGSPRIIYTVALATNFRDVLLGRAEKPDYIVPLTANSTTAVGEYWRRRWLDKRVNNPDVIERVRQHTLMYPVGHGARVPLLLPTDEELGPLFQE